MSTGIPTLIEKGKGAMVAAAIGDALGWPNERPSKNKVGTRKTNDRFVAWTRKGSYPNFYNEEILPGEYSDDTQLILAVSRSLIYGDWERFFSIIELPYWLSYERGGGAALKRSARSWKQRRKPLWETNAIKEYFDAGGNGAAMRILPHVLARGLETNVSSLVSDVIKNTLITHGHPRAFLGATCYAYALNHLLHKETILEYGELISTVIDGQECWGAFPEMAPENWLESARNSSGFDYFQEWSVTRTRMLDKLMFVGNSLKKGLVLDDKKVLTDLECFSRVGGAGDVAALAAIYLTSRYANNPSLGIKIAAFSMGADTDTIASMTGGLLGILNGINWVPVEWRLVQDYGVLVRLPELLMAEDKRKASAIHLPHEIEGTNEWIDAPIGKMRLVDTKFVSSGKNAKVAIKKWKTALGQTLYTEDRLVALEEQVEDPIGKQIGLFQKSEKYNSEQENTVMGLFREASEKFVSEEEINPEFVLNKTTIATIANNPEFQKGITIGKVVNIIQELLQSDVTDKDLAEQYKVREAMVGLLRLGLRSRKQ